MTGSLRTIVALFALASAVHGERVIYDDTGIHVIDQDYTSHNIIITNGTIVTLENEYTIIAPDTSDDGEEAVRVEDATFHAKSGVIKGGLGIGGTGVTISTTRDSEYVGSVTFEDGIEVYGGDAVRERTTQGGDAVQVLQSGSKATFNGGKFVPGTGCTIKTCGVDDDDGKALQVAKGEADIKGGTFEGVIYNLDGKVRVHGCVEYDDDTQQIKGVLLDGSRIDVAYEQPNGQNSPPDIVYESNVCPNNQPGSTEPNGGQKMMSSMAIIGASFAFGIILNCRTRI